MKIDIIVCYIPRYNRGHLVDFVPPITGIHLAAITPPPFQVRVIHQQVQEIDLSTPADIIALSFFSGFAPMAYHLAGVFRAKNKIVIGGGPHVTFAPDEASRHFDSILIGEAEDQWSQMLHDAAGRKLRKVYRGNPAAMEGMPVPRYDLIPKNYFLRKVVQATRGCYYSCSFCSVPSLNPGYRMRPVRDVIADASYDHFTHWWQRKIVWFWDDNLLINRKYAFELLQALKPLKKWWLTQASIDIANDPALLKLMKESGCIGVFIGIESFTEASLGDANKKQNKLHAYQKAIRTIHDHGICVMAGLIAGFDSDTRDSIVSMADEILRVGVDVPFISILTPFKGTELFEQFSRQDRLIENRDWKYYNGYNVAYRPARLTPAGLLHAHRSLWKRAFSFTHTLYRISKSIFYLRPGALLMCLFMNAFYGLKGISGNLPRDMSFSNFLDTGSNVSVITNYKNNRA